MFGAMKKMMPKDNACILILEVPFDLLASLLQHIAVILRMKKHSTALQMFVHTMVMHQEALLVQASTIISQSRYVLFTLQKRISDNTLSSIFAVLILDSGIVYIAWITLGREEPAARQMVFMHQLQRLADEVCVDTSVLIIVC